MADTKDSKRFTLARKEKQNADIIRKQNLARIFITSTLNEDIEQDDMSVALQDGVLLCKLINCYKPDSIKKYNATPRTPFKMMENASHVVEFGKKNQLGVNFTADDITNKDHLILILSFILSIAEKMGWTPPIIADITTSPPQSYSPSSSPSPTPGDSSPLSSLPQSFVPSTSFSSSLQTGRNTPNKGTNSLKSLLTELIASEKDFMLDMELFFRIYVGPSRSVLPAEKTNAIFGNIENVVGANNKFIMELQMVLDGYMSISSVWKNFASAINIYSVYCIFQQNSYGLIEQCRREFPAFEAHLKTVEYTVESKNVGIFNFLVKPFARVVKYNSTLKQLLQVLTPGTEDHDLLTECKKEFQDLSDTTSETWKKVENSRKIAEISGNLVGAEKAGLRKLGRIYLREGDFNLNGKSTKLYLFSDIIVHAVPVKALLKKSGGKSFIFKGIIALNACTLHDLPDGKEGKNVIELVGTGEHKFRIVAPSASEKRLWVTDISKAINKFQGNINRDHPLNPSPLEPRPMLGGMGRASPARHNSQTQIVEERRKTVKLAFAGDRSDDDEDEDERKTIEEKDEVQLEMKDASMPISEEDKRKTIKLEFAGPRQLSMRDRSTTVDLSFKKGEEKEDNNGAKDDEGEQEEDEDKVIVDKRKTVKLDFKIPRPSPSPSLGSDIEETQEEEREKEREILESSGGTENEVEDEENDNESISSEQREDHDLEILSTDMRNDTAHYNIAENSDTDDISKEVVNNHLHEVSGHENNEKNHISTSKEINSSDFNNESAEISEGVEIEEQVEKIEKGEKEEDKIKENEISPATEKHIVEQSERDELADRKKAIQTALSIVEKAPPVVTSSQSTILQGSDESDNIIATLIGEIQTLKSDLKATQDKLDKTVNELEKEKEETKVWKIRVERILSVLLDAMKQSTNSRS